MALEQVSGIEGEENPGDDEQIDQHEGDTLEGDQEGEEASGNEEVSDEVVITIGDEKPPEEDEQNAAPAWVKELRKSDREKAKRIRELEQQVAAASQKTPVDALGAKPTLEGCDFDSDKFETDLTAWHDRKRVFDDQAAKQRKNEEDAQAEFNGRVNAYNAAKAALKVPDFEDAEAVVLGMFNPTQQAIMVKHKLAEKVVYAVGKNSTEAKKLAAINDPVDFAFAVADLGNQLKITPRKAPPPPENKIRSTSGASSAVDNVLERLQAEADKSGDRSKVAAYMRSKKQSA